MSTFNLFEFTLMWTRTLEFINVLIRNRLRNFNRDNPDAIGRLCQLGNFIPLMHTFHIEPPEGSVFTNLSNGPFHSDHVHPEQFYRSTLRHALLTAWMHFSLYIYFKVSAIPTCSLLNPVASNQLI